jgi:molybdopterin-containing oxidoreductase family iron-sulfur binding subunit
MAFTRRALLQLTAAGAGALAADAGIKQLGKLIPYVTPPQNMRPGEWLTYATTCRECPAGCGMHVRFTGGRAQKAEGNPQHPFSAGALCMRGQSALQGLYDADRLKWPLRRTPQGRQQVDWATAVAEVAALLKGSTGRLVVLTDLQTGTLLEILQQFGQALGARAAAIYEALDYHPLRQAHGRVFGRGLVPRYNIEKAQYILSLGADFLETWVSPVELAAKFGQMNAWHDGRKGRMGYVGPRLSMTAANADDVLLATPRQMMDVALTVLDEGVSARKPGPSAAQAAAAMLADRTDSLSPQQRELARGIGRQMAAAPGVALAGWPPGGGQLAEQLAAAAALINAATGAVGPIVDFSQPHALSGVTPARQVRVLLESLGAGDVLLVHSTNPAFTMPGAQWRIRDSKAAVVYMGTMLDETAELADWVLPVDYPLEAWGDYEPYAGMHLVMQPAMQRMYDTRHAGDVLLALAAAAGVELPQARGEDFIQWLRARWRTLPGGPADDEAWATVLRQGGLPAGQPATTQAAAPTVRADAARPASTNPTTPASAAVDGSRRGSAELWAWPSIMFYDGRTANRGWLQEAPDPMSYATWGTWVDISEATAASLGIADGDILRLTDPNAPAGRGGPAEQLEAPARVSRQMADGMVAVMLGQGHWALGSTARGVGANTWLLLAGPPQATAEGQAGTPGVAIARTGRNEQPNYTSPTQLQYHRELLQWERLDALAAGATGSDVILPTPAGYRPGRDVYKPHEHRGHRWAMVIDLERCIGCGACAVACYAENNVPVVGAKQVANGREMAWLKVVPYRKEDDHEVVGWLPVLCQQCDAAPCEPVCPVFAAVHNEEGINSQVYNRCIGTRYCNNNCPYKVRRFNWFEPKFVTPLDWQLNPDVTARCRGVMEKCTFCIQRIRHAQWQAKLQRRELTDDDVRYLPACAATCPTRAIVLGDLHNPDSLVTRLTLSDPRRYHVLEELNTKPAITYLRRIDAGKLA